MRSPPDFVRTGASSCVGIRISIAFSLSFLPKPASHNAPPARKHSLFPRNALARHALPRLAQLALDVVDGHVSRAERHGRQGKLLFVAVHKCEHGSRALPGWWMTLG